MSDNFFNIIARGLVRGVGGFFSRVGDAIDRICNDPEHLQRLSVVGAGMAMYPMVAILIWIIWTAYPEAGLETKKLDILGFALYGAMALWGLVVVAILGVVRNLKATLPGGSSIEIEVETHEGEKTRVDASTS